MGMYCCCGAKISTNEPCICDKTGWHDIDCILDLPIVDGVYFTRYMDNGGDHREITQKFFCTPRIEYNYFNNPVDIHWEFAHWDDNFVLSWKELPEATHD